MFTESQNQELNIAHKQTKAGYNIISKHPEWSSYAMNIVWNKVLRGEDIDTLIKFIPYSGKNEEGKEGNADILFSFGSIYNLKGDKQNPLKCDPVEACISYCKQHPNCSKTEFLHQVLRKCFKIQPTTRRVKFTECIAKNRLLTDALFAEGIPEAYSIFIKLKSTDIDSKEIYKMPIYYALDDMNIRGTQLIYAYNYCDGDYRALSSKVSDRDKTLVDYINQEVVRNKSTLVDKTTLPKAVCRGASFTNGIGFEKPKVCIIRSQEDKSVPQNVQPLSIDYSIRSIDELTDEYVGLKILHSLGFEDVSYIDQVILSGKPYKDFEGIQTRQIILQNPLNGAFCEISNSSKGNLLYGGMDIMIPFRVSLGGSPDYCLHAEINRIGKSEENWVARIGENYVTNYKAISSSVECIPDTTVLGYNPHNGIRIPEKYVTFLNTQTRNRTYKHPDVQRFLETSRSDLGYSIGKVLNLLSLEENLKSVSKDKRWLYEPFLKDKYAWVAEYGYLALNIDLNLVSMGVAVNMLDIPLSEVDKYISAIDKKASTYIIYEQVSKALKKYKCHYYGQSELVLNIIDEFDIPVKRLPISKEKQAIKLFQRQLSPVVKCLQQCGISGPIRLYEHNGDIVVKSINSSLVYSSQGVSTQGLMRNVSAKQWVQVISKTIKLLTTTFKKPIKEVRFNIDNNFSEIKALPHPQEKGSYLIELH